MAENENKPVWTHNDDKQLSQLVSKYAPNGIRSLTSEVESLNTTVRAAEGTEGKDAARREFWKSHRRITDEDTTKLNQLHSKACAARLIESDEVNTLNQALAQGLIGESEHRTRVDSISSHALTQVRRCALDLIGVMDELSTHATFGATATDEDKARAVAAFEKSNAWSQALTRFRATYDAADIERKAELQRDYPELYQSAISE